MEIRKGGVIQSYFELDYLNYPRHDREIQYDYLFIFIFIFIPSWKNFNHWCKCHAHIIVNI